MKHYRFLVPLMLLTLACVTGLGSHYFETACASRNVNREATTDLVTPAPLITLKPVPAAKPGGDPCLDRDGPLITLSGDFTAPYRNTSLSPVTRIDARLGKWRSAGGIPFRIGGGANACVAGGEIIGNYSLDTPWDAMHDTYAIMIRGGLNYLLSEVRIHNYGDGVYIGGENNDGFIVRGAYLSQIRDDAFQNDNGKSGLVEDCLVDSAYVAFSDQKYTAASPDAVWEIRDNLVRLQVYEQTYVIGKSGHGWFWKWDADGIKLSLHGNIFYAEAPSLHRNNKLWPEKVVSCKKADGSPDNIIVWGGTGPYPRPEELETGCFTLTTDRAVWNKAVAKWKSRHNR